MFHLSSRRRGDKSKLPQLNPSTDGNKKIRLNAQGFRVTSATMKGIWFRIQIGAQAWIFHGLQLTLKKQQKSCSEFLGPRKPQARTGLICSHTEYKWAVKPSGTWDTHRMLPQPLSARTLYRNLLHLLFLLPKISVDDLPSCVFSSVSSLSNNLMPRPVRDAEYLAVNKPTQMEQERTI